MNTKLIGGILILALIVGAFAFILVGHQGTSGTLINSQNSQQAAPSNQTSTNSSKVLFANTQYAPYSYQIYPEPISQQAASALAGFNITSIQLQNSSSEVKLSLTATNQSHILIIKPGYKLYIIEATFGDDGYHFDSSLGDDGFVLVDPNGYVAA
jgi:hypothetical protein